MGLKDKLLQLDLLTVFCLVMAFISWFLPYGMTGLWIIVGVLWQLGKAQKIKSGIKDAFASLKKPASPAAPLGVQPVAG